MPTPTILGLDIGGTKIHGIRMDQSGVIYKETKILSEAHLGFKSVFEKIKDIIKDLLDKSVQGIGIGLAGPLNYEQGIVIEAPNMPGWENIPIKNLLEKEFNLPVQIENDAKCFVLAEHRFGAGKGYANMVGVTIGTGIGGGIIINNQLYRGRDNIAGEIGHMAIKFDLHSCHCGSTGCLERFASGTAILERTIKHIKSGDFVTELKIKGLTTRDIYNAAVKDQDPLALHIVTDTGKYLGIGIANIVNILNPEIIVLGGSVAKYNFDLFAENMRGKIKERSFSPANEIPIVVEKLSYPGTMGAALVALREVS
jgi:glucokinase